MGVGFGDDLDTLYELERQLGPSHVHNSGETNIFVGKVSRAKRALMELKTLKPRVFTEPIMMEDKNVEEALPLTKKRRVSAKKAEGDFVWLDSDTASEDGEDGENGNSIVDRQPQIRDKCRSASARRSSSPVASRRKEKLDGIGKTLQVVQLSWVTDSLKAKKVLPLENYVVYTGRRIANPDEAPKPSKIKLFQPTADILTRARADSPPPAMFSQTNRHSQNRRPHLLTETTSEHEQFSWLPPLPEYCTRKYCCQRPTPSPTPNDPLIAQLKRIRRVRELTPGHESGRGGKLYNNKLSYEQAIAAIAAYPHTITSVDEILRLPGCGTEMATIYCEWKSTGHIAKADELESEKMQALSVFFGIHGVAEITANKFFDRGWRDLDDIVEYGWNTLSTSQKLGVKYYDDINTKMTRKEAERIGDIILDHANTIQEGFQMVLCGGYRREKKMVSDVDVILTHPDEAATDHFIDNVIDSLLKDKWICDVLTLSNRNSERDQVPLEWIGGMSKRGSGFDSLDKAFLLWQDPQWPTEKEDLEKNPKAKNPNPHRRVDIIISPWKTAGCAILGWSGANMFQKDIRNYCRKELNYKFDSSGVRRRDDGAWIDLEGDEMDLVAKEKRVFKGLGLEWIEPALRCTDG